MKKVLAFDFGGSTGRALLGSIVDGKLQYSELKRFDNNPIVKDDHMYWDFETIISNIKQAIQIALPYDIEAIGVDTWGVDYGLIDNQGKLIANPIHYRDDRTLVAQKELNGILSQEELYNITGIQDMRINTIYQLFADKNTDNYKKAKYTLMMPDLIAYFLTGVAKTEYTIASTTALLYNGKFSKELFEQLDIDFKFPPIIKSGEIYGNLSASFCDMIGDRKIPVVAVCTHDTASAIVSIPTLEKSIFISCGTWSLMGIERDVVDNSNTNFTNEGGYGNKITYLKNIMGLWLMQNIRREYSQILGHKVSFRDLDDAMIEDGDIDTIVDTSAECFVSPNNMTQAIKDYALNTNQKIPKSMGQIVATIYKSLAKAYKVSYDDLIIKLGVKKAPIHMIGGGSKADILAQMTANLCNTTVVCGPIEATAIGNILVQLIAIGEVDNIDNARKIVINSETILAFNPQF